MITKKQVIYEIAGCCHNDLAAERAAERILLLFYPEQKKAVKKPKAAFVAPELHEMIHYAAENDYPRQVAEMAFKHYSVANWRDSTGKQVKNWKQKMQSVWFKPQNKVTFGTTWHSSPHKPSVTEAAQQAMREGNERIKLKYGITDQQTS